MKRMEDDAEAKAKLGEMLTEYLTLMDYLDQGIATATAAKADAVEDYIESKGNWTRCSSPSPSAKTWFRY